MRVDQLYTLPNIICSAVRLGARRGAAIALVSVKLHTGMYLGGLDHGFPATSSAAVRRATMLNSPGFVRWSTGLAGNPIFILFRYEML